METSSQNVPSRKIFNLNPNIFLLGLISFLTDVSSEMIFTLLPLFLANILGAAPVIIGTIEGIAESTAAGLKTVSGWLSDKLGKRKALAILGYGLSALAKPFMYIATTWGIVLAVRFSDRLGKGIRTAPRDALVADSLSETDRGKGFGIHRTMDTLGAATGLIIAAVVVFLLQGNNLELVRDTYQKLIIIGVVPAILALFVFIMVRDKTRTLNKQYASNSDIDKTNKNNNISGVFDKRYKIFLGIMFLFTLGNSSDAFLILRAQNLDNSIFEILLMLILFNVVYALSATPAGIISDKLGRKKVLVLGWLIYAITYFGFAVVSSSLQIWILFACYGLYHGLTDGIARAFIADLVPEHTRGSAYGIFHGIVSITLLPASIIAGWLWQTYSPAAPFYFGAGLSFLAMIGILTLIDE